MIMEHSEIFKQRFLELIDDLDCKKSEIPTMLNIDYNIFIKITEFGIIPKPVVLIRIADYLIFLLNIFWVELIMHSF